MNKKGFTLVELLAVITIIALISTLTSFSVIAVTKMIKESMWKNKVELIENGATRYGEENNYFLKTSNESCQFTINSKKETHANCLTVKVEYLINRGYVATSEIKSNKKVIINNTNDEIVNNTNVYVWIDNNIVYAKYVY